MTGGEKMRLKERIAMFLAILGVLARVETSVTESTICRLLVTNLDDYEVVRMMMLNRDYITISHNKIALTDKGRQLAAKWKAVARMPTYS
jgi:predicted transcriptional regulator